MEQQLKSDGAYSSEDHCPLGTVRTFDLVHNEGCVGFPCSPECFNLVFSDELFIEPKDHGIGINVFKEE